MIAKCDCESDFQDSKYGKGQRVCNLTMKNQVRCTVCLKQQNNKEPEKKQDKKSK